MKKVIPVYFILIPLLFILAGCKEKVKPGVAETKRQQIFGISAESVEPSVVDVNYETSGTVVAKTVSIVASRMMGTVTSLRVKEGDRVVPGKVLLTVDDSDVAQKVKAASEGYNEAGKALDAARENKNLADITFRRYKRLHDEKAVTGQELDQVETQKKVADIDFERAAAAVGRARAGLDEARVYHGFTRVVSPVRGIVTEKKTEVGSMAVPGTPLLTVEDDSAYRIEVNGDESLAGTIRTGMPVSVFVDALQRELPGIVTEVVPSIDPASRSFVVKIALKGEGLRNGFYGRVSIPIGKKRALLVPKASVVEKGQLTGVYIVGQDSVVRYRLVKIGKAYADKVEVLSGLSEGEQVVVGGVEKAVDGGLAVTKIR